MQRRNLIKFLRSRLRLSVWEWHLALWRLTPLSGYFAFVVRHDGYF